MDGEVVSRIIAGRAKGRRLGTPTGANTRPTTDRVTTQPSRASTSTPTTAITIARVMAVDRWSALLAYAWTRWQWCAAYPELARRTEAPLAESRARRA